MQEGTDASPSGRSHPATAPSSTRNSYIVNGHPLLLKRTSSLADLAREHKRQRDPQNDVRKFFLDGESPGDDLQPPDQPEHPLWSKKPAPEHSNLLYRTGSRVALQAGLEIGEGYEPHKYGQMLVRRPKSQTSSAAVSRAGSVAPSSSGSDDSSDSEIGERVLHIARKSRSNTISSDASVYEANWPWRLPSTSWVASALGFSAREPSSAIEKFRSREKALGFDPALVLAIAAALIP